MASFTTDYTLAQGVFLEAFSGAFSASSAGLTPVAAALSEYRIYNPPSAIMGQPFSVTISAMDQYGNTRSGAAALTLSASGGTGALAVAWKNMSSGLVSFFTESYNLAQTIQIFGNDQHGHQQAAGDNPHRHLVLHFHGQPHGDDDRNAQQLADHFPDLDAQHQSHGHALPDNDDERDADLLVYHHHDPSLSATPSPSPSISPSPTASATPTVSPSSTPTKTLSQTFSPTPSITQTPSPSRTITLSPSASPTASFSPTLSQTFTLSPTPSASPSVSPPLTPVAQAALKDAYPNPLRPLKGQSMKIPYQVPGNGAVHLKLYNMAGEKVRTLVDGSPGNGSYVAQWDGRNDLGDLVASGLYLLVYESGGVVERSLVAVIK